MIWIDTHIHVSDIGRDQSSRERLLEDLLDVLGRCHEDLRLVISCDFPYIGRIASDPELMLPANRMIHELVATAPGRLFGACMVNPNFLDASLRCMDVCFGEWGFVMLGEMLPYSMKYVMDSDNAERVVQHALDFDAPVQVHLGTYWHRDFAGSCDGMDHMRDLLRCVQRVPSAKYILAHAIGCGATPEYVPWADMFLDTIQAYFPEYPDNFWIEIRDFHAPGLKRTVADVPSSRLLAGTDWTTRVGPPFQSYGTMFDVAEAENPFPPGAGSMMNFMTEAGATEQAVAEVAFRNAQHLLKLDLG